MRRGLMFTEVAVVTLGLLIPAQAQADNTTAANAEPVVLGQMFSGVLSSTRTFEWFKVRLVAGRSYAAYAYYPFADQGEEAMVEMDWNWFFDDGTTGAQGVSTLLREPRPIWTGSSGDFESIIPTTANCVASTGCTYRVRLQGLSMATGHAFRAWIVETTLFSPYWAVATASGYDAAPQIKNNGNDFTTVVFTAFSNTGAIVFSNFVSLGAGGMRTFGISGPSPGCSVTSVFGSAQIAFHRPPGYITANTTTFSGAAALPFDAPFTPRTGFSNLEGNYPF